MTGLVMDLTRLEQFYILIYFKVDLFLIIYDLTYIIFFVNFCNQLLQSTIWINLLN